MSDDATDLSTASSSNGKTIGSDQIHITATIYDESYFQEKEVKSIDECFPLSQHRITWINITGIGGSDILEAVGSHLQIHPLILEDVTNIEQRPKTEDFEQYLFLLLKRLDMNPHDDQVTVEQVSIILGQKYVISFQEKERDVFEVIRVNLRMNKGRARKMGADYLTYSIIDAVVDSCFVTLEKIGEATELLEERLLERPGSERIQEIHCLKRDLILIRRSVWPMREVISRIVRSESDLVHDSTIPYLRDVYDHTIQIIDTIETSRDLISSMLEIYLSSMSNRLNEIMKILTIVTTVFIPLTLITGLYGMNFRLPELEWTWGYPTVLLVMLVLAISMILFFKRRKWL